MKRRIFILTVLVAAAAAATYYALRPRPSEIVLTGIVTTDQVIVSGRVQGQLDELTVKEGDIVTNGQLLARIQPQQWQADLAFYADSVQQTVAQREQAAADLENARLTFEREENLWKTKVASQSDYDQARTAYDSARARVEAVNKQIQASRAQKDKAQVQLDYTEVRAPTEGFVDTRAALKGEVVNPGQAIVTLINPDNLWVRADVEETYIDRIKIGDKFMVRLPSGVEREGTVFYRNADADYATQRDVSRTKRDIKTFEIRLHCDNTDRRLALGMTAYVKLDLDGTRQRTAEPKPSWSADILVRSNIPMPKQRP